MDQGSSLAKLVYELVCTSLVNLLNRLTIGLTPDPLTKYFKTSRINAYANGSGLNEAVIIKAHTSGAVIDI